MPALAIVPVDLSPAAPQSTPSSATGNDELFASHLKNATNQHNSAASSKAGTTAKHSRNRHARDGQTDTQQQANMPDNVPAAAAHPTATTDTLPSQTATVDTVQPGAISVNPQAADQNRESAVMQLLARLTAGATSPGQQTTAADAAVIGAPAAEQPDNQAESSGKESGATTPAAAHFMARHAKQSAIPMNRQTDGQMQTNNAITVQNRDSQFVAIHFEATAEDENEASIKPGSAPTTADNHKVDVNGNYIRSRLPKGPISVAPESGKNAQMDNEAQAGQQKSANIAGLVQSAADDLQDIQKPFAVGSQETSSLLVSGQQQSTGPQPASSTPISSIPLQLPSGITVPDNTVVDQMLAHFSGSKRFEGGTVTIRLYPEELGEVRMKIKVDQDNIKAHITAQTQQAQEMINRHLFRLREALEQQGLHLQQVEVLVSAHNQNGSERFQESNAWRHTAPSSGHGADQADPFQESDDIIDSDPATGTNILSVHA
jgi:Flagellar hook-length control protein